jgi:hypothetical protein
MYLDPGFGSMLIQALIAAIAVGGAYLLLFKKRIVGFFKKKGAAEVAEAKEDEGKADK